MTAPPPGWLREIPAVDVLRRVLVQNYMRTITADGREVIRRREKEPEGDGLPPGHIRIASPYDTDARWGVKREEFWLGYKLHVVRDLRRCPALQLRPGLPRQPVPPPRAPWRARTAAAMTGPVHTWCSRT